MHPICNINVGGKPASPAFMSAVISVTVTDKEGTSSDTIDIEMEAGTGLALPLSKAIITCAMGYQESGAAFMGAFTADDVTLHCLPYKLKIQGKSADMRAKLKEHKNRHWDGQTFGGVVQEMAGEGGLAAHVDPSLAGYKGKAGYFNQGNESNIAWIDRMARRLGGVMSVKDGRLSIIKKGAGLSISGLSLGGLVVRPSMILANTCQATFARRPEHGDVEAAWQDPKTGLRKWAKGKGVDGGEAGYRLRGNFDDEDTAKAAAESRGQDLRRASIQTQVTVEGNVAARGGAPMTYAGVHPGLDGIPFIIETATHSFSKGQGYRTQISAQSQA